jgi:hypothetical protein
MPIVILILVLTCAPFVSFSQNTFNKTFGFQNHSEEIASLIQLDSFYYFTGGSLEENSNNDSTKLVVLKSTKDGVILDSMNYQFDSISNGGNYNSNNIIPWGEDGFCLAGSFQNKYNNTQNGAIIKFSNFSSNPAMIKYILDSIEIFPSLFFQSNSFYVTGMSNSFNSGSFDYYLMKSDTSGNVLIDTTYGGLQSEYIGNTVKVNSNHFAFCGRTFSDALPRVGLLSGNGANAQFIAVDSNFNELWNTVLYTDGVDITPMLKDYGFFYYTIEYPVHPTILGLFREQLVGQIDLNNGNVLWLDTIKIEEKIIAQKFMETVDSTGFIVFTEVESPGIPYSYAKIIKYNNLGEIIWQRSYYEGNHNDCHLNTMIVDDDGYLVFGGTIANLETQSQDIWLLKLRPDGCLDDTDCGITTGLIDLTPGLNTFGVFVFPNPSNDIAHITIENTANYKNETLELQIYDFSGKLVYSSEQLLQGQIPLFNVDVSTFNSGTYIIQTCVQGKECGSCTLVVE